MNRFRITIISAFVVLSAAFAVNGQDGMPESKRKLIAELMELTDTKSQIAQITDSMLESMERVYPVMVRENLSKSGLTEEEKGKLSEMISESHRSFTEKFRERLPKVLDYEVYLVTAIYPLYDRYFTEKELSDLVAFYKTETGRKVVSSMPLLTKESMEKAEKYLTPKLMKLIEEILDEQFPENNGNEKQGPPPPPAKPKKG